MGKQGLMVVCTPESTSNVTFLFEVFSEVHFIETQLMERSKKFFLLFSCRKRVIIIIKVAVKYELQSYYC